jgi:hypothetical protein
MRLTFDIHPPGTLLPTIERLQADQGTRRIRGNTGTATEAWQHVRRGGVARVQKRVQCGEVLLRRLLNVMAHVCRPL